MQEHAIARLVVFVELAIYDSLVLCWSQLGSVLHGLNVWARLEGWSDKWRSSLHGASGLLCSVKAEKLGERVVRVSESAKPAMKTACRE